MKKATLILIVLFTLLPLGGNAHPGRTAADGCHYCRTNCDSWGVAWNARHCHGGYVAPPTYTPPPAPTPKAITAAEEHRMLAIVTEVIDGDTVRVRLSDGTIEKVRIIGMDTPESKDPRKPVECFANEATEHLRDMLKGSSNVTTLVRDDISGNRDTYRRLLRHLEITPTADVAERDVADRMIRDGYAYAYTKYPFEKNKIDQYVVAEKEARAKKLGLWASGECEDDPRVASYLTTAPTQPMPPVGESKIDGSVIIGKDAVIRSETDGKAKEYEEMPSSDLFGLIPLIVVIAWLAYVTRPSTWRNKHPTTSTKITI